MSDSVRFHGNPFNVVDWKLAMVNNGYALFNSGAGRGNPISKADSRHLRHFLRPSHTIGASSSMAGRGGNTFGYAGSLLPVFHIPPCACHPSRGKLGAGLTLSKEAIMPSISCALTRLFPAISIVVSTLPTLTEARALSALLVSRGKRVCIQSTDQGFTVSEVKA
ncbi:hypothetical protein [Aquitalea magnusonii]|uniref:hypothetical protein n=1 Tax=Aquitalea magnusonii TaxID=332411 RepID=UPI0011AE19D3|nr:hypothetical protein [Aquitalea magnusonii]